MDTIEEQVNHFSNKCDDLMQAKFIIAPSKISELLRTVAASPALVSLFEKAVRQFDYLEAQSKYMLPSPDGTENKGILLLPEDPMERLAFIFCLLVDIDDRNIDFNLFLQTFFAGDGSYTESFALFLTQIVRPFKAVVCEELTPNPAEKLSSFNGQTAAKRLKRNRKNIFGALLPLIKDEVAALNESPIGENDRYAGIAILNELYAAAKASDEKELKALLLGYNYFVIHVGKDNKNTLAMFDLVEEL